MTGAIEQAVAWLERNKGCGWACLKCNFNLQCKFESLNSNRRKLIVDAICSCDVADLEQHPQLLWLVALLSDVEFEEFVRRWARQIPFERPLAWRIIRLSAASQGEWRFNMAGRRPSLFKPRFHLHPIIAPSLLETTIRPATATEDAVALLDYFEPIASDHCALKNALPLWHAELERREAERKAEWLRQAEERRLLQERVKADEAAREARFHAIESNGPAAVLRAIKDASPPLTSSCPERWAKIPENILISFPQDALEEIVTKLSAEHSSRAWRGMRNRIGSLLKSRARSAERRAYLSRFDKSACREKLEEACSSKWPLIYYPEDWAELAIQVAPRITTESRQRLLSKLMRLQRRSRWRKLRRILLRSSNS